MVGLFLGDLTRWRRAVAVVVVFLLAGGWVVGFWVGERRAGPGVAVVAVVVVVVVAVVVVVFWFCCYSKK